MVKSSAVVTAGCSCCRCAYPHPEWRQYGYYTYNLSCARLPPMITKVKPKHFNKMPKYISTFLYSSSVSSFSQVLSHVIDWMAVFPTTEQLVSCSYVTSQAFLPRGWSTSTHKHTHARAHTHRHTQTHSPTNTQHGTQLSLVVFLLHISLQACVYKTGTHGVTILN